MPPIAPHPTTQPHRRARQTPTLLRVTSKNQNIIGPSYKKLKFPKRYAELYHIHKTVHQTAMVTSVSKVSMSLENILVVGKDCKTQNLARPFTKQLFSADDADDTWQMIDSVQPHLILLGSGIGHQQLCSFLETKEAKAIDTPVVIIGDKNGHQQADHLISLGAYDYIKGEKELYINTQRNKFSKTRRSVWWWYIFHTKS